MSIPKLYLREKGRWEGLVREERKEGRKKRKDRNWRGYEAKKQKVVIEHPFSASYYKSHTFIFVSITCIWHVLKVEMNAWMLLVVLSFLDSVHAFDIQRNWAALKWSTGQYGQGFVGREPTLITWPKEGSERPWEDRRAKAECVLHE